MSVLKSVLWGLGGVLAVAVFCLVGFSIWGSIRSRSNPKLSYGLDLTALLSRPVTILIAAITFLLIFWLSMRKLSR
jgi:hypothetical protein